MTVSPPLPAHRRLAAIDPALAEREAALIDALDNRLAGHLVLRAAPSDRANGATWIAFDGLHVAPLLVDSAVPMLTDAAGRPDAAPAAVALGTLEPVIAALEVVVGRSLLPVAVTDAAPGDSAILAIEAQANGQVLHRLLLSIAPETPLDPAGELPVDPASIVDVAPPWTATIAAPPLRRDRLESMGVGDLLLLGTGRPLARFTPPGQAAAIGCRLHVEGGSMSVERAAGDGPQPAPHGAAPQPADAGHAIPVHVDFDGGGLTLAQLATLAPGSAVPVSAIGGTLPVRLRVEDRVVAAGELVAIGEGYGVLVTGITADPIGE